MERNLVPIKDREKLKYWTDGKYLYLKRLVKKGENTIEEPVRFWGHCEVVNLFQDDYYQQQFLQLKWADGSNDYVSRGILVDKRLITDLVAKGRVSVPRGQERLQDYLTDVVNAYFYDKFSKCSQRFGWVNNEFVPFSDKVVFLPTGKADEKKTKLFKALTTKTGTLDEWIKILKPAWEHSPILRLAMGSALSSILVGKDKADGFFFSLWGVTSQGKSKILQLVSSMFGEPATVKGSCNTTLAGFESLAEISNNLPLILDELQNLKNALKSHDTNFSSYAYSFCDGEGKTRATVTGDNNNNKSWRCVSVVAGENLLSGWCGSDAGAKIRIIDVRLEKQQFSKEIFESLTPIFDGECYGHILPLFVKAVQGTWNYKEYFKSYRKLLEGKYNSKQINAGAYILTCVDWLNTEIFKTKTDDISLITPYLKTDSSVNPVEKAMEFIKSWCVENQSKFITGGSYNANGNAADNRDLDKQTIYGKDSQDGLYIICTVLNREGKRADIDILSCKEQLAEFKFFEKNKKGDIVHNTKICGKSVKCYKLSPTANIEDIE